MPLNEMTVGGRYVTISTLGEGGMGTVYKARDTTLDRMVALKLLKADVASASAQERFRREGQVLAGLTDEHIVQLLDQDFEGTTPYLVFELVKGETLEDRLRRSSLTLRQTLELALDIAAALVDAHGQGIIHRDLKPANIFVTPDGARLLDFGIAHLVSSTIDARLTDPGNVLGTPHYMAPEYISTGELSPSVDLWSLGVVMFECLTGRRPFHGPVSMELIDAIVRRPIPRLTDLVPGTPASVIRFIERCMDRDPKARWSDIHEFRAEVEGTLTRLETPDLAPATQEVARTAIQDLVAAQEALARKATPLRPRTADSATRVSELTPVSRLGWTPVALIATLMMGLGLAMLLRGRDAAVTIPTPGSAAAPSTSPTAHALPHLAGMVQSALGTPGNQITAVRLFTSTFGNPLADRATRSRNLERMRSTFRDVGDEEAWKSAVTEVLRSEDGPARPDLDRLNLLNVTRTALAMAEPADPGLAPTRKIVEGLLGPYFGPPPDLSELLERSSTCWIARQAFTADPVASYHRPLDSSFRFPLPKVAPGELWLILVTTESMEGWVLQVDVDDRYAVMFVPGTRFPPTLEPPVHSQEIPQPSGAWRPPGAPRKPNANGWKFYARRLPTDLVTDAAARGRAHVDLRAWWIRHPLKSTWEKGKLWHMALALAPPDHRDPDGGGSP